MPGNTLWDAQLVEASALTIPQNEQIAVLCSGIKTANNNNSLRLTMEFEELTPDSGGSPFDITTVVEAIDGTRRYPVAYQFTTHRYSGQGEKRVIVMQPDISDFNAGIDDVVWTGKVDARISRQQGIVPAEFEVCVYLTDRYASGAPAFVSVKVSGTLELYNV